MLTLLVPRLIDWRRDLKPPLRPAIVHPPDWPTPPPTPPDPGPWLVARSRRAKEVTIDDPGNLLEQFIDMVPSEGDVLAFARSFGLLGVDDFLIDPAAPSAVEVGESFGSWVREHSALRFAAGCLAWLARPDTEMARRAQRPHPGPGSRGGLSVAFDAVGRPVPAARPPARPGFFAIIAADASSARAWRENPVQPVREQLARLIDSRVAGVRLEFAAAGDGFSLEPRAPHLVSALWLEMAQRAATRRRQPCAACGKWFPPKRSTARFCSIRCQNRIRQKAHRATRGG